MKKKIFALARVRAMLKASMAVAVAMAPALVLAAPSTTLNDVSIDSGDGGVRITLETSAPAKSSFFTLKKPHRVVIDFRDTTLAKGTRMPSGIGAVNTVRTGPRPNDGLRVVIELKSSASSRGEWQPAFADVGDRFVVAIGSKAFVAAAFAMGSTGAQMASATAPATAPAVAPEVTTPKTVRPQHAPIDGNRDIVVAVDAGHGGQDPGAIGRNGTMEKNVVLAIARALASRIDSEPGMRAYLVRDDDFFVVLRDRMVRARNAKADIFVSVHADAIRDRSITGASVYVISERGASSEAARWLAERENAADLMGGVKLDDKDKSLASVLLDLSQTANISASMTAAERVLLSLDASVNVRKSKVQQAPLLVLKSPDIPSMLVETAYISNPGEESRLKSISHQTRLAEAIFSGVRGYFEVSPPPGTRFAQIRRSQLAGVLASPASP